MAGVSLDLVRALAEKASRTALPDLNAETRLAEMPIDSLDLFSMIAELEEASGKSLSDSDFERMNTVGDLVRHFSA